MIATANTPILEVGKLRMRCSDLPKVTQFINARSRIQIQAIQLQSQFLSTRQYNYSLLHRTPAKLPFLLFPLPETRIYSLISQKHFKCYFIHVMFNSLMHSTCCNHFLFSFIPCVYTLGNAQIVTCSQQTHNSY